MLLFSCLTACKQKLFVSLVVLDFTPLQHLPVGKRSDLDVFKTAALRGDSNVDFEKYASDVTGYISTCVNSIVPTKCCKTYTNQKPWINCEVRSVLRARSTAFLSGDAEDYKKATYNLRRSISKAERLTERYAVSSGQWWGL